MQSMINYSPQPMDVRVTVPLNTEFTPGVNRKHLNKLWANVCLNDITAFEAIHKVLYPLLFKYAYFIIKNPDSADTLLADAFINFWCKRACMAGPSLLVHIVGSTRLAIIDHLNIPMSDRGEDGQTEDARPVILFSDHNSLGFADREEVFLREFMGLDRAEIAEIRSA